MIKVFGAVVGVAVLGIVTVAGISMVTAPVRMASGVVSRTMNADNAIASYERFHDLWKGFDARLAQIAETKGYLNAETDPVEKQRLRVDLSVQRASCREIAGRYNADAAKTNKVIFQGREAPSALDMTACDR